MKPGGFELWVNWIQRVRSPTSALAVREQLLLLGGVGRHRGTVRVAAHAFRPARFGVRDRLGQRRRVFGARLLRQLGVEVRVEFESKL
jgi:hypothetical protein